MKIIHCAAAFGYLKLIDYAMGLGMSVDEEDDVSGAVRVDKEVASVLRRGKR